MPLRGSAWPEVTIGFDYPNNELTCLSLYATWGDGFLGQYFEKPGSLLFPGDFGTEVPLRTTIGTANLSVVLS